MSKADLLIQRRLYEFNAGSERVRALDDLGMGMSAYDGEPHHDQTVMHSTIHVYVPEGESSIHEHLEEARRMRGVLDEPGPFGGLSYNAAAYITGGGQSQSQATPGKQLPSLSTPTKMPGKAYGIPAEKCQVGAVLHKIKGSTCFDCYALKNNYQYEGPKQAAERRYNTIDHPQWVNAMATMIHFHSRKDREGKDYHHAHFRWHDSGDIQSVEHLAKMAEVARLTPKVKHWVPTREYEYVKQYREQYGREPKNMIIRLSGHYLDKAPPRALAQRLGLPMSSTTTAKKKRFKAAASMEKPTKNTRRRSVIPDDLIPSGSLSRDVRSNPAKLCPAPAQGNSCGDCRACWDPNTGHVIYHKH